MSKWKLLASDIERDNESGLVDLIRLEFQPESKKYAVKVCFKDGRVEPMWTTATPHRLKEYKRLTAVAPFITGMGIKRFEVVYPEDCGQVEF